MLVSEATVVFFDASCLFAAAMSPNGGSGLIIDVCGRGFLRAASSRTVLDEAERNIRQKCPLSTLVAYRALISETPIAVVAAPSASDAERFASVFLEDAHVIASAVTAEADVLLTLDRRLIARARAGVHPFQAVTPKEFIDDILPLHPDFATIR
jgi:predicted nucleic acid-binding protein